MLRCPDVLADGPEPEAAARAFEPVIGVVEEFCPQVEVLRPGLVAIAARGPARYFGGEAALAARLTAAVAGSGSAARPESRTACSPRTWPHGPARPGW